MGPLWEGRKSTVRLRMPSAVPLEPPNISTPLVCLPGRDQRQQPDVEHDYKPLQAAKAVCTHDQVCPPSRGRGGGCPGPGRAACTCHWSSPPSISA
eukprot:6905-Eustigmatos_ZCMA.PRE.1